MYRAVLFDLDDTLYDLRTYRGGRLRLAIAALAEAYPELDVDAVVHGGVAERIYIAQLPDFLRRQGVTDERLIAEAQETYKQIWFEEMQLADDAAEVLQRLRPTFRLGLVTNGPSWTQRAKIERMGLEALLDVLVVSGEVGVAKPDPAIFRMVCGQLGVRAEEALFVGDSAEYDLAGAAAVGMACVWVNRHGDALPADAPRPTAEIRALRELLPLLGVASERR